MRHDDGHVGKVDSNIVDVHWITVFQPHAAAARHSGANARMPGVKYHRKFRFSNHFIEWIHGFVVGVKLLQRRMELESANAALCAISRRASFTASGPRIGSTLAKAITISLFSAAKSTTSSFETCGRPVSRSSTEKTTQPILRDR